MKTQNHFTRQLTVLVVFECAPDTVVQQVLSVKQLVLVRAEVCYVQNGLSSERPNFKGEAEPWIAGNTGGLVNGTDGISVGSEARLQRCHH